MDIMVKISAEALKAIALEVAKQRDTSTQRAPDDYIPHPEWQTGRSRRGNAELARSGVIACRKVGKVWLARRADVLAWIEANGREAHPSQPHDDDGLAAACRLAAGRRRG